MKKIENVLKYFTVITLLTSPLLVLSCTTDPGSVEAMNSASKQCRNIIGIEISNISNEQRIATKYAGAGVYVSAVIPKHPADIAGLKPGDIILSINSTPVSNVSEALMVINELEAGRNYPFRICRMTTKLGLTFFTSDILLFTRKILIEKVQEREIGRISWVL